MGKVLQIGTGNGLTHVIRVFAAMQLTGLHSEGQSLDCKKPRSFGSSEREPLIAKAYWDSRGKVASEFNCSQGDLN